MTALSSNNLKPKWLDLARRRKSVLLAGRVQQDLLRFNKSPEIISLLDGSGEWIKLHALIFLRKTGREMWERACEYERERERKESEMTHFEPSFLFSSLSAFQPFSFFSPKCKEKVSVRPLEELSG